MTTDKTIKSKHQPKQTNVTWIDTSQKPAVTKSYIDGAWVIVGGGGGGTNKYSDLEEKPLINGVELDGNKTSQDLGVYSKPSSGIPQSDLSSDVQSQLNKHFKGWYASSNVLPANPVVGDYAYVKGASSTDPAAIYECTTAGSWSDSGRTADTSNVQTFASGEEVNETPIDDTHLVNPADGALALATDTMQLNANLIGVGIEETKPTITPVTGSYVKSADGTIGSASGTSYCEIDVTNASFIRFLGLYANSISITNGYAFGHYTDDVWTTDKSYYWNVDTALTAETTQELIVRVPIGSTHFRTTCVKGALTLQNFYCYIQYGEGLRGTIIPWEEKLAMGYDYTWLAGTYSNHSLTGNYHTSPIHIKAGETIISDTRYTPNMVPAIVIVPNNNDSTSYNNSVTTVNSRFNKDSASWFRREYTAKYDMYVTCSATTSSHTGCIIKIRRGGYDAMQIVNDFNEKKKKALDYLPKEYEALKTNIDERIRELKFGWYRKAVKEREIMISQVAMMNAEDMMNQNTAGYTSHVLTEGKCGYYIDGSNNFTDDTIHWKLYDNGILYISGYGKMYDFVKGVSGCMTKASIDANYPLNGNLWYYNMPENGVEYTYAGEGSVTYQDKRYLDQTYGDSTNPINNYPYGYAAPWYIYRAETDFSSYVSPSSYAARNPNNWKYDRICIVEDTSNGRGGITYIGNWNFYRNTCESLILPNHVTKIGAWGVRYSTTMRYLYTSDSLTEIEDHGISRNEALEYINFGTGLTNLWLNALRDNNILYAIEFKSAITDTDKAMMYSNPGLVYVDFNGMKTISNGCLNGLQDNSHLLFANIGEGCETIDGYGFNFNDKLVELTIPSTVTTIGNDNFRASHNMQYVTIDSSTIASVEITNIDVASGGLFVNPIVVRVKSTISTIDGIEAFFSYVGEKDGYKYYTRINK